MGHTNYVMYAAPFFFFLMALEFVASRKLRRPVFRINDVYGDLACGMVETIGDTIMMVGLLSFYDYLYKSYGVISFSESNPFHWLLALLGLDFFYYWFHRASHRVNLFWAAHVVHHQSEDYNLAVALRQSSFQALFSFLFYIPLAFIGFSTTMLVTVYFIDMFYQYWIHTRLVGKLGPLEWILNTPSHHRVHHGRNPKYMDKNYAGVFIIWDRLFGTYIEEQEEPIYGVTTPLQSFNPITANFQFVRELIQRFQTWPGLGNKLQILWRPPNWQPLERGGPMKFEEVPSTYRPYDPQVSKRVGWYVLTQLGLCLLLTTVWLHAKDRLSVSKEVLLLGFILFTLVSVSGFFQKKSWLRWSEPIRFAYLAIGVVLFLRADF